MGLISTFIGAVCLAAALLSAAGVVDDQLSLLSLAIGSLATLSFSWVRYR